MYETNTHTKCALVCSTGLENIGAAIKSAPDVSQSSTNAARVPSVLSVDAHVVFVLDHRYIPAVGALVLLHQCFWHTGKKETKGK